MRVLVTGGAGFIGSHVVDALAEAGCEVVVIDALFAGAHERRPEYLNPLAEYRWADLRDGDAVSAALHGVTAVSHQASMVGLETSFEDVMGYVDNNDVGTAVLLREMHRKGFSGRLVLGSSMVVYGEGAYECPEHGAVAAAPRLERELSAGRFDPPCPFCGGALDSVAVTEAAPLDPRNVYAATKLHQEHLCGVFARRTGAGVTALRYHNVYGPRMPRNTPYAGVASIFMSALRAGRAARVTEDGRQLRDFVHVKDVARANLAGLFLDDQESGAFNIASGNPRSVGELARALTDCMGGPAPVITGDFRLGDVRHVFASPAKAQRSLGWRAEIGFEQGVNTFSYASSG